MRDNLKTYLLPLTVGLLLIGILACIADGLISLTPIGAASAMLELKVPLDAAVLIDKDTGPGLPFPGGASDSETFIVLQIPPEKMAEFTKLVKASPVWKSLPLPPVLAQNESYLQPTILSGLEGTIPIETSQGYYLFIDRQQEHNDINNTQTYNTSKLFSERSSLNYTFGLFDDRTGKLYLWSIDT